MADDQSNLLNNRRKRSSRWLSVCSCLVCTSITLLCAILLISLLLVWLDVPLGLEVKSVGSIVSLVYREAFVPSIIFLAEIVKLLFPWPVFFLLILSIAIRYPEQIAGALSSIGKFEGFGVKYEGASAKAPSRALRKELGEAERGVANANRELEEAYETANAYAAELRDKYEIGQLVSALAVQVAKRIGDNCPDDYRLTLYIQDLVFNDRLYQFSEYYDRNGDRITHEKAGRTLSIRYGVVGRAWRSGVDEIEGDLLSEEDNAQMKKEGLSRDNPTHLEMFIARRWGLVLEEVAHISRYNSYAAVRIDRANNPVGLIYFDSKQKNAFGDREHADQVLQQIEELTRGSELVERLVEISRGLKSWAGSIQVFRSPR